MATRKRSRTSGSSTSSMRRTTSLSEFPPPTRPARGGLAAPGAGAGLSAVHRRHSLDCFPVTETAAFLKVCGFCRRGLGPGRDIFIYISLPTLENIRPVYCIKFVLSISLCCLRGEAAFCSQECRQQQMNLDELMETKCFPPAGTGGGSSDQSGKGSTIATT